MAGTFQHQTLPLADIIVPKGVSIWPLALGWWLVLAMLIAIVIGLLITYKQYRKKWGYRREALRLLKNYQQTLQDQSIAIKYLECLKRTAISAYPTQNIQALHGQAWVDFLNMQTPTPLFNEQLAHFICNIQYQQIICVDKNLLHTAVIGWIKKHYTQVSLSLDDNQRGAH